MSVNSGGHLYVASRGGVRRGGAGLNGQCSRAADPLRKVHTCGCRLKNPDMNSWVAGPQRWLQGTSSGCWTPRRLAGHRQLGLQGAEISCRAANLGSWTPPSGFPRGRLAKAMGSIAGLLTHQETWAAGRPPRTSRGRSLARHVRADFCSPGACSVHNKGSV